MQGGDKMKEKRLGQYLRALRKTNGYTQEFIASYLDISRQAYSHYETNRVIPPNDICYKIAHLYGISTDKIINFSLPENIVTEKVSLSVSYDKVENFLDYINNEENRKKLHSLSSKEKELIYYFDCLSSKDKNEIIEIIKLKLRLSNTTS